MAAPDIRRHTPDRPPRAAVGCILLSIIFFTLASSSRLPPRPMLREVEGVLDLTTPASPGKYGTPTQFRLSGDTRIYQYISKSGEMGKVEEELLKSKALPVRVLVDPRDQFSTVLELEINGRIVRSYDDIVTAWRADGRLGMWAASVFGTAGVVMFALSRKQYRDA